MVDQPDQDAAAGDELHRHRRAVAAPARDPRRALREVAVAPLHQREEGEAKLAALVGEAILEALGPLAVADALEDADVDEPVEAVGEDVARDAEAREQLVEPAAPERDVADDQQRPPVAHDLERAGDRANLAVVGAPEHPGRLAE